MTRVGQADAIVQVPRREAPLRRWAPLLLLALIMAGAWAFGLHEYLTLAAIAEHRADLAAFVEENRARAVICYLALYALVVALSIPGSIFITITGGFLFGWALGGVLAVIGATTGATLLFLIARTALGELLRAKAGPRLSRFAEGFRRDAFHYLLFLRVVPLMPFWLANLAAAFLGMGLAAFIGATFIGIMPAAFAFASFGAGLDSVIAAHEEAHARCLAATGGDASCGSGFGLADLLTPQLLVAMVALGAVALIPVGYRRWKARAKGIEAARLGRRA